MKIVKTVRLASVLLGLASAGGLAQSSLVPPPYGEFRADAILGRAAAVQTGGGVTIPMGIYVRLGLIGAVGETTRDGAARISGRTDAIARFLFDPLRETPVALSLGGGVSVPYEHGTRVRPYLTAVMDLEGRRRGRLSPALQIGLGGGARIGVALRTSAGQHR